MTSTISICGSGTMGRGIALACIQRGYTTYLYDINTQALDQSVSILKNQLEGLVSKGKMTKEESDAAEKKLFATQSLADIAKGDIIIEAILEQLSVKDELFSAIEQYPLADTTILASNTSSISINALAKTRKKPENFLGLHFFNPAHIMKLVEIIKGNRTRDENIQRAYDFALSLGKTPVIAKDVPGFIVNRVARNYYNEAMRIAIEQIADIPTIDNVMKNWGFKMGPFALMDLIGNDVNIEVTKSVYAQYFNEPRFSPSTMQQDIVNAGMYGKKTQRGFYDYSQE